MDITKEELNFDKEGNAVYTLQIKDFHNKMKSWESGKYIESKHFKLQDVELYLSVYPNGIEAKDKGYISVYLGNATKKKVFTSFKVKIGQHFGSCVNDYVEPEEFWGWETFLQHSSLVNQKQRGDEQLKVICRITKLKYLDTEGTFSSIENIEERLNDAIVALNKSTASQKETERKLNETTANQKETERMLNETNAKLAQLEVKINELDKGRKGKKPSCPVCYEEMLLNTRIAQCISGHLICWSCKEKMVKNDCPSCGRPVNGRAFGMESYLKYLFQD